MTNKKRFIYLNFHVLHVSFAFIFLFSSIFAFSCIRHANAQGKTPVTTITQEKGEIPDWLARWELAKVLSYSKRYDESVAEYRKLLKEKPNFYEAMAEMARVLFYQGKHAESLVIIEQIPVNSIDDNTRIIMADIYIARKEYAKAEPLYRAYLNRHPEDVKTRLKLADMLSWVKRYNESLTEYKIILNALPNDIQVRRKYAFVLIWSGRHNEAAEELKKTLK